MTISLQDFINKYNGVYVDFDGAYGAQCADLFNQYTKEVVGGNPYASTYNGAQEIALNGLTFGGVYTHISSEGYAKAGDVAVWSGSYGAYLGGGFGHVAIVAADEQPGGIIACFSQNPNAPRVLNLSTNGCLAYLRPTGAVAPAKPVTAANQRVVGAGVVNYRDGASTAANIKSTFNPGDVLDFKGFVHGENVSGNDIWYVGAYTGGYAWSGGFLDSSTNGLNDLTVAPASGGITPIVSGSQRTTTAITNYRKSPSTSAEILGTFDAGATLNFSAFTHGENVSGNDVWFKGALTGGYVWSGACTDTGTHDLAQEGATPAPTPAPAPAPTPAPAPEAYSFTKDFDFVEYLPANINNVQRAVDYPGVTVFPAKPEKVVIHQFGTVGIDTIGSTVNQFRNPNLGDKAVSAHFVVSGKRIVQMVSLKDRAYHAYVVGNNYVGIESDPAQDADTIASVNKLLKALKAKYGYTLTPILHKNVPQCSTNCGASINLGNYQIDNVVPTPEPTPTPVPVPDPEPTPVPEPTTGPTEEEIIDAFLASLKKAYFDSKK